MSGRGLTCENNGSFPPKVAIRATHCDYCGGPTFIRFSDEALGLGDALSEANLACLDLCCLLLSPLRALFGVRHGASTIRASFGPAISKYILSGLRRVSAFQSLKDFANRAHGAILKVDGETAGLKIGAYAEHWHNARPI